MSDKNYQNYWDLNIKKWGELYFNKNLHKEDVNANFIIKLFYQKFVFPIERSVMQQRYELTIKFLNSFKKEENLIINDIGCGTGLFSNILISKGYKVNAIDFSNTALESTEKYVSANNPDKIQNLQTLKLNVVNDKLPKCDYSLCMGVLPYVKKNELSNCFQNISSFKDSMLLNWVDSSNLNNKIRMVFRFLNVRNLNFQNEKILNEIYSKLNLSIVENLKSGTGYLHILKKSSF
tara:strand:- start:49 stop:753 length:705 start_codon:yes stop_codon:yes gene_type:complete